MIPWQCFPTGFVSQVMGEGQWLTWRYSLGTVESIQGWFIQTKWFRNSTFGENLCIIDSVVMLTKERHREHKKVDWKTYIYIQDTSELGLTIVSWESSRVATIVHYANAITWLCHVGLDRLWSTPVNALLTCIYGGGWVNYVGSATDSYILFLGSQQVTFAYFTILWS